MVPALSSFRPKLDVSLNTPVEGLFRAPLPMEPAALHRGVFCGSWRHTLFVGVDFNGSLYFVV